MKTCAISFEAWTDIEEVLGDEASYCHVPNPFGCTDLIVAIELGNILLIPIIPNQPGA